MKKFAILLGILGILAVLAAFGLFLIGYFKPKGAGIIIETKPVSVVFLNGDQVGRTPYEVTREPSEIVVKLVPESSDKAYVPFETKVNLSSGIKTVIRRDFGDSEETSAGEIISFEKVGGSEVSLAVISIPDAAQVSIDGQVRGFTPSRTSSLVAGEHQLAVSATNYLERTFTVRTISGYKLTAVVKLARTNEPPEKDKTHEEPQTFVEILPTGTGFLRVRATPSIVGIEVGQVKPGEKYPFLEEDEKTGWFKIEYDSGKQGWVSNQYSKKIEELVSPSPTPKTQ